MRNQRKPTRAAYGRAVSKVENLRGHPGMLKGNMIMTTATTATPATTNRDSKPLGALVVDLAISGMRKSATGNYAGIVSVAMLLANRQIERAETDKDINAKKNKGAFTALLKAFAYRGETIWTGTDHLMPIIMAKRGKDREKLVADYIDGGKHCVSDVKKPNGATYVEHIKLIRTWSFRLMDDVCTNHASIIRDLLVKKAAGVSSEALVEIFADFVKETYGDTLAKLTAKLAPVKTESAEKDPVETLLKRAIDLPDAQLQLLVAKLQGLLMERASTATEMMELVNGPADQLAEPATPEAVAA